MRHARARRRLTFRWSTLGAAALLAALALSGGWTVHTAGAETTPPVVRSQLPGPPPVPADVPPVTAPAADPGVPPAMARSAPVRLQVPSIGVDSSLMELGLNRDGTMQVPPTGFPAGWYTGSPSPGELGPAILAGHVDWARSPGVFFDLRRVAPGDEVHVSRQDGTTAVFRVTRVEAFAKDEFPTATVYGDIDHSGLRLITCGGVFDRKARSYVDNLVVFAELVVARG